MKKTLVLLLVLAMIVCAIPAFATVSGAEGAAATNETATDYTSLYVEEGLKYILSASTGVDLTAGTWTSTNGQVTATIVNPTIWKVAEDGGLEYNLGGRDANNGINLGIANLPTGDYTVEMTAMGIGYTVDADGVTPLIATNQYGYEGGIGFAFGPLKGYTFPAERAEDSEWLAKYGSQYAFNEVRYFYSDAKLGWHETYALYGAYGLVQNNAWRRSSAATTVTVKHTLTEKGGAPASEYSILNNGSVLNNLSIPRAGGADKTIPYIAVNDTQEFVLFRNMPARIYSIRVYDRALTEDEIVQNHFAEMAEFYKLDLTKLEALSESQMSLLKSLFTSVNYATGKETAESLVETVATPMEGYDPENTLYVTDGLTLLYMAYDGFQESVRRIGDSTIWLDQISGEIASLRGNKWQVLEEGGVEYRVTHSEWSKNHEFGLVFDIGQLPEGSFTVETVVNPIGTLNEDGTQYIDDTTQYGTYVDNGFAFGPFKAMTFVCKRPAGKDGQLEHRWVYVANGCWAAAKYQAQFIETAWKNADGNTPVSFSVWHLRNELMSGDYNSEYRVYSNGERVGLYMGNQYAYIPKNDTDKLFRLMYGIPGGFYAVRVYDRTLTTDEMNQNHLADLVYHYDLNTTLLDQMLAATEDPNNLYSLFKGMGFGLDKAEAQAEFERVLSGFWATVDGLSIRMDNKTGIRAQFTLNPEVLSGMEANGYTFEIGALLNMETEAYPTLETNDYRIVAYANGVKNEQYFIDEDSFVFAVYMNNPTQAMMMQNVKFTLYIKFTDDAGNVTTVLSQVKAMNLESNTFALYNYFSRNVYDANVFISGVVDACYAKEEIYLSASGAANGTGTEDAPFATLAEAVAKMVELIGESALPMDVKLHVLGGKYVIDDTLTLADEDLVNSYYRISILGDGAETTTVTSNRVIDSAGFTKVEGKEYYKYQFEADGEGAFPAFRYLYVNGKIATLAHSGSTRFVDGDQYTIKFERLYDPRMSDDIFYTTNNKGETVKCNTEQLLAAFQKSQYCAANKFYLDKTLFEGCTDGDYAQMELHIQTQWDFNIMHITHVDFEDVAVAEDGTVCVATYFNEEERAGFQIPGNYSLIGRQHWLENSLAFVDEPGEYYYDVASGALYYYPMEGEEIADTLFERPQTDNLLVLDGLQNVTVSDITFTGADDMLLQTYGHTGGQAGGDSRASVGNDFPRRAAIYVKNGADTLTISNCIFDNLGCEGVTMKGRLENITVEANQFFDIGSAALRMADRNANWDANTGLYNVEIMENYFDNAAWSIRQAPATQFGSAKNFQMGYNTITHCSYTAISIGWRWSSVDWEFGTKVNLENVEIFNNYIAHFMTDEKDGGAIYTLGGNANPNYTEYFNYLYFNYIVFTKDTGCEGMVNGIYHDGSSSNWHDYNNVIAAASDACDPAVSSHFYYIYIQHIDGQETHNVLSDSNYIFNLRKTDEEEQVTEVYRNYLTVKDAPARGIEAKNTHFMVGLDEVMDSDVVAIVMQAGSGYCVPEIEDVLGNDY